VPVTNGPSGTKLFATCPENADKTLARAARCRFTGAMNRASTGEITELGQQAGTQTAGSYPPGISTQFDES